ncbi:MAG: PAS domain S-box protein [Alphaproteobacteria bacterium]|nr:PAS domain S-box protein [Alphaproteobacteria bacterium]
MSAPFPLIAKRTPGRLYGRRLVFAIVASGVGSAMMVALTLALTLNGMHRQAIEGGRDTTANLARSVADAADRSMQAVDVALTSVTDLLADAQPGDPAFSNGLYQKLSYAPHLRQIVVVDGQGVVRHDSARRHIGLTVSSHADLRARTGRLKVGALASGRFLGGDSDAGQTYTYIPVARLLEDGTMVIAAVNPQHFEGIFDALDLGRRSRVAMFRHDGAPLVWTQGEAPLRPADEPLFTTHLKASEFGTFEGVDSDGVERITSYRMTMAWPLVVSVGLDCRAVLTPWRTTSWALAAPAGAMVAFVLVLTALLARAVARRARDEEALALSDRALATVSNGVIICDATQPDCPLIYVNPAFERTTGYQADEVLGHNPRFLHGPDTAQDGLALIQAALSGGDEVDSVLRNYRKDGTPFWNELSIGPVRDAAGKVTHYVGVQRDITERIAAEGRLRASLAELARTHDDLERFSEILAHHLQEPVRQVVSYLQLLERHLGELDGDGREFIGFATGGALRLKSLLSDAQLYLEAGRAEAPKHPVSADSALDTALAQLRGRIAAIGAKIQRQPLPAVMMDKTRLTQLLHALLDNALEHRHPDRVPHIRIEASEDGDIATIRVTDNGFGIAAQYHERIFRVFERLSHQGGRRGTGTGLAIARRLVEQLGGQIGVISEEGVGSAFFFSLPTRPAASYSAGTGTGAGFSPGRSSPAAATTDAITASSANSQ